MKNFLQKKISLCLELRKIKTETTSVWNTFKDMFYLVYLTCSVFLPTSYVFQIKHISQPMLLVGLSLYVGVDIWWITRTNELRIVINSFLCMWIAIIIEVYKCLHGSAVGTFSICIEILVNENLATQHFCAIVR